MTEHTKAVKLGLTTYTGKRPCKLCGGLLRFTCSYNCAECAKTHRTKWRNNNKEKAYQSTVNWREKNKEKYLDGQRRWREEHKEKQNEKSRQWQRDNKDRALNTLLIRQYGIDLKRYKKEFKQQHGRCDICKEKESVKDKSGKLKRLAVDHCHKTGKFRALLCSNCNTGIGRFNDNHELLQKAADYIKKHDS